MKEIVKEYIRTARCGKLTGVDCLCRDREAARISIRFYTALANQYGVARARELISYLKCIDKRCAPGSEIVAGAEIGRAG